MRLPRSRILAAAAVFGCWAVTASPAAADLVYLGTTVDLGSGIGGQQTLLSFQSAASGATANAAVIREGGADAVLSDPDTQINGGSNNQTRTFDEAGITDASEFRLVWNLNEPADGSVFLDALRVSFYDEDDNLLHVAVFDTASCASFGCEFEEVGGGIGTAGHVFGLDATQITVMNGFSVPFGTIRVGLGSGSSEAPVYVALSGETGGFETFYLASAGGTTEVPEPSSMLLIGAGLLGLGIARRRR